MKTRTDDVMRSVAAHRSGYYQSDLSLLAGSESRWSDANATRTGGSLFLELRSP